jgi:hypothetical protein
MSKFPVDPERMRLMEVTAREIAAALGRAVKQHKAKTDEDWGFALFLFSFHNRGELTYISNANRDDMVKMLLEFVAAQPPATTWDDQHG